MLPILHVGPLSLPVPPLLLLAGLWIALEWTEAHTPHYQVQPEMLYRMVMIGLAAGLVGARLGYAARSPQAFLASPLSLLAPQPQMLDLSSGLVAAGLAAWVYAQRAHASLWPTLDALTTLFAVLAVAVGLSHFASGDAFGAPARLPWSIELWGEARHPSQVYETLAAMAAAAAVWPGSRVSRAAAPISGARFWIFVALSAAARLFLEAFRGDSLLMLDSVRQAQVIAWVVLAVSLWQIRKRFHQSADSGLPTERIQHGSGID